MRKYCLILCIISMLPACNRIVDWSMDHFYQGEKWENPKYIVRSYIRKLDLYFELETYGLFTALWLNDPVRCSFAYLYSNKCAKTEKEAQEFMESQLKENKKHISFYVMAYTPSGLELNDRKGYDMSTLEVDNKIYFPVLVEKAELNVEYLMFLRKVFDKRKKVYLVKFNAFEHGKPVIGPETEEIKLVVRSISIQGSMDWRIEPLPTIPHIRNRCLPGETAIPRRLGGL